MRIEFFMPMKPPTVTHQEKKWRVVKGKPVPYEPPEVRAARSKLTAHLAGHRPVEPLAGAVRLLVKWCFPRGQHEDGEYRTTRPDTDNLQKLLKDCMTAVGSGGMTPRFPARLWKSFGLRCRGYTSAWNRSMQGKIAKRLRIWRC